MPEETPLWEQQPYERQDIYLYKKIYLSLPSIIQEKPKIYQHVIDFLSDEDLQNWVLNSKNSRISGESRRFLSEVLNFGLPIPTLTRVSNIGSKWKWKEAERSLENYRTELAIQKDNEEFLQVNEMVRSNDNLILEAIEKTAKDLKYDLETKPSTKAHALQSLSNANSTANKDLRLSYGKSTENITKNSDVVLEAEATVTADVSATTKELTNDEFMESELEFGRKLIEKRKGL